MVRSLRGISEIHSAPLDIEDTIGRSTRHRREDTACSAGELRTAGLCIGALVIPVWQDGVVVSRPWQADVDPVNVGGGELRIAVGRHIDAVKGLVIQRIAERQTDKRCAVIGVITGVRRPCHDAATDLGYVVMICRRAAFYCVHPRKCRIRIASYSSNRSGPNARRHAASEIEVHREPRSRVAVDYLNVGHAAADVAGQGQIARRD